MHFPSGDENESLILRFDSGTITREKKWDGHEVTSNYCEIVCKDSGRSLFFKSRLFYSFNGSSVHVRVSCSCVQYIYVYCMYVQYDAVVYTCTCTVVSKNIDSIYLYCTVHYFCYFRKCCQLTFMRTFVQCCTVRVQLYTALTFVRKYSISISRNRLEIMWSYSIKKVLNSHNLSTLNMTEQAKVVNNSEYLSRNPVWYEDKTYVLVWAIIHVNPIVLKCCEGSTFH